MFASISPMTGETIAQYPEMSTEEVQDILEEAHQSQQDWRATSLTVGLPAIATATATTAAAVAATTTAATAATARCLRLGFIDFDFSTIKRSAVQFLDSFLSLTVTGHLDKSEALALAGVAIGDGGG